MNKNTYLNKRTERAQIELVQALENAQRSLTVALEVAKGATHQHQAGCYAENAARQLLEASKAAAKLEALRDVAELVEA